MPCPAQEAPDTLAGSPSCPPDVARALRMLASECVHACGEAGTRDPRTSALHPERATLRLGRRRMPRQLGNQGLAARLGGSESLREIPDSTSAPNNKEALLGERPFFLQGVVNNHGLFELIPWISDQGLRPSAIVYFLHETVKYRDPPAFRSGTRRPACGLGLPVQHAGLVLLLSLPSIF